MLHILMSFILSINGLVITDENSLKDIVNKVETEKAKYKEYANKLVEMSENKLKATLTTIDNKDDVIDNWLNNYEHIKANSKNPKLKEGFYIFVSFSLPRSLLLSFDETAQKIGARLVIRGLKDNSFKETLKYIQEIRQKGIIVDIDPESFQQHQINLTPAFVMSNGLHYDKIIGNVSVPYVLNKFITEGETSVLSKKYLKKLENDA